MTVSRLIRDAFIRWHRGYYGDGGNARDMIDNNDLRTRLQADGMDDIVREWDRDLRIFAAGYRSGRNAHNGTE